MPQDVLHELAMLIESERDTLLAEWRAQVRALPAARNLDVPSLNDHIPTLLIEIATALRTRSDESIAEALVEGSPPAHGMQRVKDSFDIEEVVAEYNILRGCIHDLAERHHLSMQGRPFHILNRVLDGAIGLAVKVFADEKANELRQRREEYLAFVAHDLRTPLNVISLSARVLESVLMREHGQTTQVAHMWNALKRNVRQLETLVGKVLEENASVETESGVKLQRRDFDLWPLVESVIHDLQPAASAGAARLVNRVPEDLIAYADAGLLRRVFQNLIANAIAYTPNGTITIGADEDVEREMIMCYVSDDGAGISPERSRFVFDKNETDPDKEGGVGLGLAIVKSFVEAHEGQVGVDSEPGKGSTFRFTLPTRRNGISR